ncbi:MAG: diacylglycerol kinase [bacterium]|nr:diacylglycerol kinase [bacterium]
MKIFSSLKHALRGVRIALKSEHSFRIQMAMALVVFILLFMFPLQNGERALLLVAVGAVLVLELVNSTVERMLDLFKPRLHPYVRDIKDLMAAAVFLVSLFALIIGIIILGPYASTLVRL